MVQPSTIPNAGDGLFTLDDIEEGALVLCETGVGIKRPDAKRILTDPAWTHANPVIQLNKNRFLDIRALVMYKMNHALSEDHRCNVFVDRTGNAEVSCTALRDIRAGEELMWEYWPTWYPTTG